MQSVAIIRRDSQKKSVRSSPVLSEILEPRMLLSAYTLNTLASFQMGSGNPWNPTGSSMVEDSAGDIFGLVSQVGSTQRNGIFELAKGSNTPTLAGEIIPTFGPGNVSNGETGGLVMDENGNIFGSQSLTGDPSGDGVVFELPSGSHTVMTVAQFNGSGNGSGPVGHLINDSTGNVFGTTRAGGANNAGTVWEVAAGTTAITVLASFPPSAASGSANGLVMDANGNLFGTIGTNQATPSSTNFGSVWELPKGGGSVNILASFDGSNGSNPVSPLYVDASDNVFGETEFGGPDFTSGNNQSGDGTIFEVAAGSGTIHTAAIFSPQIGQPVQGVTADAAGDLFGVTTTTPDQVFELPAGGNKITQLTTLGGDSPLQGLLLDSSGDLFGTTQSGGTNGDGAVFELTPSAASSSLTQTLSGKIPSAAIAGQKVNLSQTAKITNSGASTISGTITAKLFLATGATVDASSIQLTSLNKKAKLKPHAHLVFRFKVASLSAAVPNGTYHVILEITDPDGNVSQTASTATITVAPPQIDLTGVFSKTPVPGKNGKTVLTITVSNHGTTAATGPLAFNIDSSPDGLIGDATVITSENKKINLKPQKSQKITAVVTLSAGIYFIVIDLDPANAFHDVSLANNVFASATQVTVA